MGKVAPFDGRLARVTVKDALKVTSGKGPTNDKNLFERRPVGGGISDLASTLPRGPSFFHDAFRLQLFENFHFLAEPHPDHLPPWTGNIRFEFRPTESELLMAGNIECAIPDESARLKLSDYCQALAAMTLAYAQLPGSPSFNLALEYSGKWVKGR